MNDIDLIKHSAISAGACVRIDSIVDLHSAIDLLMSPQGREFALKSGFPTLDIWRGFADQLSPMVDVMIDAGDCILSDCDFIAVGNTRISAEFANPSKLYHVIAMHGADVEVAASNYAVVTITSVNANVNVHNDGTAIIRIER